MGKGLACCLRDRLQLLLTIKDSLSNDNEEKNHKTFVFSIFKVINKLIIIRNTNTLIRLTRFIYKQVIDLEVSFEGGR
jgi:hypothetical protein